MPLFDDGDSALLKKWVVTRLENISDADSDVLADYVLALLRHEQSEAEVRQMCIDQLDDFLREHTTPFVDQLFAALRSKSYLSVNSTLHSGLLTTAVPHAAPVSIPQPTPIQDDADSEDSYTPKSPGVPPPQLVQQNANPKKRGYYDRDAPGAGQQQTGSHHTNSRNKNPKTQGRGGNRNVGNGSFDPYSKWARGGGDFGRSGQQQGQLPRQQIPQAAFPMNMMPGPAGALALPNPQMPFVTDPMTQLLAAQAVASLQGGWNPLAMFQPPPNMMSAPEPRQNNRGKRGVCHSFEQKGYCRRGDNCPYLHASPLVVPPPMTPQVKGQDEDEYDPHTPMLSPQDLERRTSASFPPKTTPQPRGGGVQRGGRGGARGGRSEFSAFGPPKNVHTKTLVVESIPDDKLDEQAIRGYFTAFGPIDSVEVKAENKLAIVKFENQEDAKKAHSSPEPIFNNRFVKVYWMKGEGDGHPVPQHQQQSEDQQFQQDEMEVDMEDFQRKQEEAQKAHDERMVKKKEIDDQAKKLEEMKADLIRRQEEEKKKLLEKLAKKHAAKGATNGDAETLDTSNKESREAQQTAALKAQLEALEAEATSLGIDHSKLDEPLSELHQSSYRGRGSFRGRGGFGGYPTRGTYPARGRGVYGAYRGTAPFARGRGGAPMAKKMTLDNRTKTVMVNGVSEANIEPLQHFLLACGSQYTKLDKNPEVEDSHIITFNTRGDAARFFHSNPDIPQVGKVSVSWVENHTNTGSNGVQGPTSGAENGYDYGDSMDADSGIPQTENGGGEEAGLRQYDVYDMADEDDDSRWN
ncbi:hypothetical protein TWF192_008383 [Orbilia oligospora]|uniref:C3H1-type domain-containing protein n=2 Tax=Orbilia oligospora TaxID=2813651 RepID=A0A6G1M2U5_ORBOL|nr:hypothetical protein TWF191_002592 [Orbilia oligospora]KAF3243210.1 hypothetical protein TWF192_008383 [Orbilia oligospora]